MLETPAFGVERSREYDGRFCVVGASYVILADCLSEEDAVVFRDLLILSLRANHALRELATRLNHEPTGGLAVSALIASDSLDRALVGSHRQLREIQADYAAIDMDPPDIGACETP